MGNRYSYKEWKSRVINKDSLARENRFVFSIDTPFTKFGLDSSLVGNIFGDVANQITPDLHLFCETSQFTGKSFATNSNRIYGEKREYPYEKLYSDVNVNFYVDTEMKVKEFFDAWFNKIQSNRTRKFNYYDNYITTAKITNIDLKGDKRYTNFYKEVYPKSIGAITTSHRSRSKVMILPVTFQLKYERYFDTTFFGIENFVNVDSIISKYTNGFSDFQRRIARTKFGRDIGLNENFVENGLSDVRSSIEALGVNF